VVRDRGRREDGYDVCVHCSRASIQGALNPNARYAVFDLFLEQIDTEAKAYLLGWIASDGTVREDTICIELHRQDRMLLQDLAALLGEDLPLHPRKEGRHLALEVPRKKMVEDVCRHLGIKPGPKSRTVRFPELVSDELQWHFVRGLFDGDGSVADPRRKPTPECSISSSSGHMKAHVNLLAGESGRVGPGKIAFQGVNAMDFLGHLYDEATLSLSRKHQLYQDWCAWVPQLGGMGNSGFERPLFRWARTHPDAVHPFKARASDAGYDLTIIGDREEDRGRETRLYRTGVRVSCLHGWYFDLLPRSSIVKTGYMLANSVGVIDRSYRGEVLVPLRKVDPRAPDLQFPARIVQLVPRPVIHLTFEEVDDLEETDRGAGGFGSTGNP
jgi:dUTP pyrophosphatase